MKNRLIRWIRQGSSFFFREYDMKRRSYMWQMVWIVYDLMWALSVGFLGVGINAVTGGNLDTSQYVLYLMIGSFMWTYLSSVFAIVSWAIVWERWEGTIEYTFMAPVSRLAHLLGTSLFAVLFGIVRLVIVFGISSFVFDFSLAEVNWLSAIVILAVSTLSFIGLGMIVAVFPLIDPENGDKAPLFLEAIIMMISGIYYPIATLPLWLQFFAKLSPATYALEGIRMAAIKGATVIQVWNKLWPLILMGIIFIPLGTFIFGLAERYAKKTGKLKRNG